MANGDDKVVQSVLADFRTAPIPEKLRAMLGFLEKLTLQPAEIGPHDISPLRSAGLSDEEIEDAIHICANFNLINRVADSLGFETDTPEKTVTMARRLLARGYL